VKNFILSLLVLFCVSCDKKQTTPKGILPKEKMISIFIDLHITESKISALNLKRDSSKIVFSHYEQEIFDKHEISEETYLKSYSYYIENVNELENIYDAVIDSLSLRERMLNIE
jgi:hypothetical protein